MSGWVNRRRDLGVLIFIDMRDREGIVQSFLRSRPKKHLPKPLRLRNEFCIQITGTVRARPENQINKEMATGSGRKCMTDGLTILTAPSRYRSTATTKTPRDASEIPLSRPAPQRNGEPPENPRITRVLSAALWIPKGSSISRNPDADQSHRKVLRDYGAEAVSTKANSTLPQSPQLFRTASDDVRF